jgi:hypothetical protein
MARTAGKVVGGAWEAVANAFQHASMRLSADGPTASARIRTVSASPSNRRREQAGTQGQQMAGQVAAVHGGNVKRRQGCRVRVSYQL